MPTRRHTDHPIALATRHALLWLVVGNGVGLLLANLLVVPRLGDALGPLTYGRWNSVHLLVQLYGWCSLPMVAVLFHLYLPREGVSRPAEIALTAWTGTLAFGAAWVLLGHNSGKLFLEWSGPAGWSLVGMLLVLEAVLVAGYRRRLRSTPDPRLARAAKTLLLALLLGVPLAFLFALSPTVYPPVNPHSGGSTGTSLLGSSLGFVSVMVILPALLGRSRTGSWTGASRRNAIVLVGHWIVFATLGHGDVSHLQPLQIAGLASLIVWWPLLRSQWRTFDWPAEAWPWLRWLAVWSAVLLTTAVATFLPGVLDRLKFTNALVAHAHLAMAGFVSALLVTLLVSLQPEATGATVRCALANPSRIALWNGGLVVMVLSLTTLGWLESVDPGRLFHHDLWSQVLYSVRWTSGLAMFGASWSWWRSAAPAPAARSHGAPAWARATGETAAGVSP